MGEQEDRAVIARDPALAGLATALDPRALAMVLCKETGLDVRPGRATYVRYKPGTNCLAQHSIRVGREEYQVYAKVYGPDAASKLDKAPRRRALPNALCWTRIVVGELGMSVIAFPNDDKLKGLEFLCGGSSPRILKRLGGSTHLAIENVLAYKAERRLTARVADCEGVPSVLKLYARESFRNHVPTFDTGIPLQLPRVIAQSERHCARRFSWVGGTSLAEVLDPHCFEQVAQSLRSLHQSSPARELEPIAFEAETGHLREVAAFVGALCPAMRQRIDAVLREVLSRLSEIDPVRASIHGDLHLGQVVVANQGVGLIDFDHASLGDPHRDLGQLCASLIVSRDDGEEFAAMMVDAYRPSSESAVRVFTDVALLRLLPAPFRNREAGWVDRIERALERLEARVARSERSAFGQLVDDALDRKVMDRIRDLPEFRGNARAIRAQLVRSKPQRRFLVRYDVDLEHGTVTVLGKGRAKGLDQSSIAVSDALFHAGGRSQGAFSVPRVIAAFPAARLWLQEWVPGRSLASLLEREPARLGPRIAEALHGFHSGCAPTERRHTRADELRILDARLSDSNPALGGLHPELDKVRRLCRSASKAVAEDAPSGIHRDLHPEQLLIAADRVTFVDLDLYALGEPALDVGNLTAHVIELGLRRHGDPEAFSEFNRAFVDSYLSLATTTRREQVRLYELLALARLIEISVRLPGRAHTSRCLTLACIAGLNDLQKAQGAGTS